MLTVEESIVINKPRLEVWEFMTDPDNVPIYNSNVVEYEMVSGDTYGVGRICRGVVKLAGRRLELTDEVVDVERGRSITYQSKDATVPYMLSEHYEDEGDGTKVIWHQESESLKGVFAFADSIVLKLYSRDVRTSLENAKTILES